MEFLSFPRSNQNIIRLNFGSMLVVMKKLSNTDSVNQSTQLTSRLTSGEQQGLNLKICIKNFKSEKSFDLIENEYQHKPENLRIEFKS